MASHVVEWVSTRVGIKDWELSSPDPEHSWTVLGLEPTWCDELLELQLRNEGDTLFVGEPDRGETNLARRIVKWQLRLRQSRA